MTIGTDVSQALRRAAVRATLAPSVHNTQPWRLVLSSSVLEVWADPTRQLPVLDPSGRQLSISCGCALFNARVALAAAGWAVVVERLPDPHQPRLLARLTMTGRAEAGSEIAALDPVLELRRTNRRQFAPEPVAEDVIEALIRAAAAEGAGLHRLRDELQRISTAVLSQRADALQQANPAYRAELRAWTTDNPDRKDGVPMAAVPHTGPASYDDVPIRDFDTDGHGGLPSGTSSSVDQCLLVLSSASDNALAWLRAGEGLERALLELTREGYVAGILSQIGEVPSVRAQLRMELGLAEHPHMLLRVGRAPLTPATRRRRLVDVLVEQL
ncbi:MAG TPA: hypothetical protein VHO01_15405 [Jatrophihabitans sp.]|nr:hypothetical protein [Jatrophihabitans sp.]